MSKKNYSVLNIYTANGDLKKRWYVYFTFRNPASRKLQRLKNIYGIANKYKTKKERMSVLLVYRKKLLELLKREYNSFEENTDLHQKLTQKTRSETPIPIAIKTAIKEQEETSIQNIRSF